MPTWGNTDTASQKPKFDYERQTRDTIQLTVLTGNTAGNNIISVSYNDGAQNNVANIGVASGQYVYFWATGLAANGGRAGNGIPGFFFSNTKVSTTSGNTITLSNNLFGPANAGWTVEFDTAINYGTTAGANTYNSDTILITPTRSANNMTTSPSPAVANVGNLNVGWNRIVKKTNNDGTVRYLKETLVAMSSPTAANTGSGNTSFGTFVTGL